MAANGGSGDGFGGDGFGGGGPDGDEAAARRIFGDEVTDREMSAEVAGGGGGQQSAMSPAFAAVLARGMAGGLGRHVGPGRQGRGWTVPAVTRGGIRGR